MKVASIGAGPGGLYFAILIKRAFPDAEVDVYEQNRADDTFGWGVVFSDETLENFEQADPESFAEVQRSFATWTDIDTYHRDVCIRSTGHGFCGLSRKRLLQIFHARCRELGVRLHFEHVISDEAELGDVDLVLAADGLNSVVRKKYEDVFRPTIRWGKAKFTWLGTTKPLEAFTFVFRENEDGLFQVHAYPFEVGDEPLSTWIVECHEDVWKRAGLDAATEADTVAYCQELFGDHLGGHALLTNKSIWRSFPTITCERWHHGNRVLLGDAVHTAHFSIGSGTKLALEDAIALDEAFRTHGTKDVPKALAAYQEARRIETIKLQKAAKTSRVWFEESARYLHQDPLPFTFNLMTRSKRITYDNLRRRDPALVEAVTDWFGEDQGVARDSQGKTPAPMFAPIRIGGIELANRVVVSPMCQYSARHGNVNDWHFVHLGSRAIGGAGLVITEMTDVTPRGRITLGCSGMYSDENERAWKRIVDFVHAQSPAKIAMQLAHAGRKGSCHLPWEGNDPLRGDTAWETLAPSALPFGPGWHTPRAMERADMDEIRDAFVAAARRAERAGFDGIELHMAHGYLLSSFLSPAANRRTDEYGGTLAKRMRFPMEVFEAVRAVWPRSRMLGVRVSASDWLEADRGTTIEDTLELARALEAAGCDVIDVSSGGNTPESQPEYGRMYQVPFAERVKQAVRMPVMAVGAILGADHVNTILAAGRADLCALARPHLVNPYITLGASVTYEHFDQPWPKQYLPAKPTPKDE